MSTQENKIYQEQRVIVSFSVQPKDYQNLSTVMLLDKYCTDNNATRSRVILHAIEKYLAEVYNGGK